MSISSIAQKMKTALTALVGAALVAGSLVAVTPASAAEVSALKQPKDIVSLDSPVGDYGRAGDLVLRGGWAYVMQAPEQNYWYGATPNTTLPAAALSRVKLSTFATSTPKTIFPMDHSATATATATSGAISSTYGPHAFDVTPDGNTAFILDSIKDNTYTVRVIKVDLSGATNDTDTNLAGTVVGTKNSIYSAPTSITAVNDSIIFIIASNQLIKGTRSGSTWSFSTTNATGSMFDAKVNGDGNLVVASGSQNNLTLTTYNPATMAVVGTAQTINLGSSNYVSSQGGITIDPSNGDVLFADNNGNRIRRLVNQSGTFNSTVKYEALTGAKTYSATALATSGSNHTLTVASTTGIKVGSTLYVGNVTANEPNAYVSTPGSQSFTVTAVTATTVTVTGNSAPFTVNGGTLRSAELFVVSPFVSVSALAYDGSVGGQGLIALDHGTVGATTPAVGPALVNFEAHALPLTGSWMNVSGNHKSININYNGPRVANDIQSYEAYLYSGSSLDQAVAAAQAHAGTPSPTCTYDGNGSNNVNIVCTAIDGIVAGTYYALAVKQIAFDGSSSWTIPGATQNNYNNAAARALDSTVAITLPTDPDPNGPASPGFAHNGPTSTTALSLLGSAYQHISQNDGRGGKFVAYKVGNTVGSEYKLVHIKNNGEVDSAFGASGVQTLSAQSTSNGGSRNVQIGWYNDGKFVFSDYDDTSNTYNFNFATSNAVNGWNVTKAEADAFCAATATGEESATVNSVTVVPAAGSDPMVLVNCYVSWRNQSYSSVGLSNFPIVAKLTANHTLTSVAAPLANLNSYATASTTTDKVCLSNWATQGVAIISDPNPTSSGTLFTALYRARPLGSNGGPYVDCYSSTTNAVRALTVKADGTYTFAENALPVGNGGSVTVGGTAVTKGHNFYLWASSGWNSPTKIYKLGADGQVDTAFGDQGAMTMANPTCTGAYLATVGLAENNAGDVYLTNITATASNSQNRSLFTTSQLLEKASGNTAELGSTHISATVGMTGSPNIDVLGNLSEYGRAYSGTAIDADGNAFFNYYSGSAGIKSVKFDSFAGALASGEDYLDCPPAPFEAVTSSAPFQTYNPGAIVRSSDTTLFMYDIENSTKASATFTFGANPKTGTFSTNQVSIDRHSAGFVVPLGDGRVMVGGGSYTVNDQSTNWITQVRTVRTLEIYDPTAAQGSRWTKLSGTNGNDLLPSEVREYPGAVLLGNGKVLVYGGVYGMNGNSNDPRGGRTSGLVITIGNGTNTTVDTVEFGASYSKAVKAGTGKWLLLGNRPDAGYLGITLVNSSKIFTEATNAVSAGPNLKSARRDPVVVPLSNGKTLIAGDSCMGMCMQSDAGTYDLYDPATNAITSSSNLFRGTSPNIMQAFSNISGGIELASGRILLLPGSMGMQAGSAFLMNLTTNTLAAADTPVAAAEDQALFRVGEKVLIAGGSGMGQFTPWQVYTQPVVVDPLTFVADNRRILKGSTGNLTITGTRAFTLGAGATELQVKYENAPGSTVLKDPFVLVRSNKLKLDATSLKLTLALPTVAQMNANAVGVVKATILQGTTNLGSVNISYIATKDTPVFQGQIQPGNAVPVPGSLAQVSLGLTTPVGNGTPVLTYKSNTAKICSVSPTGMVVRLARGECQIVASQAADLGTNAVSQTYKLNFQKSNVTLAFGNGTPAAGNLDLTEDDVPLVVNAIVDNQPAIGFPVAYAVDNDDKCSIDDNGVLNTLATGTCTVTASFAGDDNANAATSITRVYNIVVPSQPVASEGTVGGVIGDAIFEAKDDPSDDILTVSTTVPRAVGKNIKLGRGWTILYTPTVKNGAVTGVTFSPAITSQIIGSISTTFIIPVSAFAKAPAGWTALPKAAKNVVPTTYQCVLAYGSKTQVAANKKIKTVVSKGKTCALPALTAPIQVKVKNNWTRLGQKKGSAVLTPQRRTAKLNIQ